MKVSSRATLVFIAAGFLLNACGQPADSTSVVEPPVAYEDELRLALETAQPGDVIVIPEGTHAFTRGLTLNTDGVTIRGAGMDKSILSFTSQIAGAEGLLVNASNFTIEDLAIEDTVGDALKINEGRDIAIRRVRTEWTNGPNTGNGAYGIYPVQTENTLVEASVAIGASDAGIYVGQSRTSSSATVGPSTTSPGSRSRTPSTRTSTTMSPPTTPAASWSSTCPTCRRKDTAPGYSTTR